MKHLYSCLNWQIKGIASKNCYEKSFWNVSFSVAIISAKNLQITDSQKKSKKRKKLTMVEKSWNCGAFIESTAEGDMGVYGIAVLSFFFKRYFGDFDFNVRYYGIILPCGMPFFILLGNGIR